MKPGKLKTGLLFGITMTIALAVQHLITDDNLTPKHVLGIVISSLVGGVVGGLISGWLAGSFAKAKYFVKGAELVPDKDETIELETIANHFKGIEAVGGKLYLTNKRLIFKSHKLNFQTHELLVNLDDVVKVNRYKVMGIVNTGLAVTTMMNKTEKFVMQEPEIWVSQLANTTKLSSSL